ncbi:hypothetical protein C8F04DRAFT_1085304 [Mycena alexandri]|uniref:Uncharacterized protein n=1 Tax=Mycena alexandri TaxID=1745969 RepID=A0AAD6XC68_9AGAR|nr:hypothetical protein C8F04DRAFT_1085304 [Mycena alexandri]
MVTPSTGTPSLTARVPRAPREQSVLTRERVPSDCSTRLNPSWERGTRRMSIAIPQALRDSCLSLFALNHELHRCRRFSLGAMNNETSINQQALSKLRIMGAHLVRDADEWVLPESQETKGVCTLQALYSWRKASHLEPHNYDIQWGRAFLAREVGDLHTVRAFICDRSTGTSRSSNQARQALLALLQGRPHDLTVLSELRTILIELPDLDICTTLFEGAFKGCPRQGRVRNPRDTCAGGPVQHHRATLYCDKCNSPGLPVVAGPWTAPILGHLRRRSGVRPRRSQQRHRKRLPH